jgi:hypothetical protein
MLSWNEADGHIDAYPDLRGVVALVLKACYASAVFSFFFMGALRG